MFHLIVFAAIRLMSPTDVEDWSTSELLPLRVVTALSRYTGMELIDMDADPTWIAYLGLNPLDEARLRRALASLFRRPRRE